MHPTKTIHLLVPLSSIPIPVVLLCVSRTSHLLFRHRCKARGPFLFALSFSLSFFFDLNSYSLLLFFVFLLFYTSALSCSWRSPVYHHHHVFRLLSLSRPTLPTARVLSSLITPFHSCTNVPPSCLRTIHSETIPFFSYLFFFLLLFLHIH